MMERVAECFVVPAGPGDAGAIGRVHVQAWRETYSELAPAACLEAMSPVAHARRWHGQLLRAMAGEVVMVAEGPEGLVGYCAGGLIPGTQEAQVHTLYLLARAQGLGLGRHLLGSAARVMGADGARSLRLWVLEGNTRAARFYEHLGGVRGPTRPVRVWGGVYSETAYLWDDISCLGRGGAEIL